MWREQLFDVCRVVLSLDFCGFGRIYQHKWTTEKWPVICRVRRSVARSSCGLSADRFWQVLHAHNPPQTSGEMVQSYSRLLVGRKTDRPGPHRPGSPGEDEDPQRQQQWWSTVNMSPYGANALCNSTSRSPTQSVFCSDDNQQASPLSLSAPSNSLECSSEVVEHCKFRSAVSRNRAADRWHLRDVTVRRSTACDAARKYYVGLFLAEVSDNQKHLKLYAKLIKPHSGHWPVAYLQALDPLS